MAKYFSIRKAIELAEGGMTRQELIEYFGITEKQYKNYFSSFSEKNKKKLTVLLISNGRRKSKSFGVKKVMELAEGGMTRQEIIEHFGITEKEYVERFALLSEANKKKLKSLLIKNGKTKSKKSSVTNKKVREVWDTSYILSHFCNFESSEEKEIIILGKVHEQLERFEDIGNKKACKFFHLVAEEKMQITLIAEPFVPKNVPLDQDPADFEIFEYAKREKDVVVLTCDKGLATRCNGTKIKCEYFNNSRSNKEIGEKVKGRKTVNIFGNPAFKNFLLRRGKHWGIDPGKEGVYVFNNNNVVKKANRHFVITILKNDLLVIGNKSFRAIDDYGNMEVL